MGEAQGMCPYERAAKCAKQHSVDDAMMILWDAVPRDVAIHETDIRKALCNYVASRPRATNGT